MPLEDDVFKAMSLFCKECVIVCSVVQCCAVLWSDVLVLWTQNKTLTGMVGNAYLPSCHFWKLWPCQWPSALHHLMLWTDPDAQRCHPFWDIYKWGFRRTAYANFITIKSNKTLRFYPKIVYDSIDLFTIIQIHPFFLFLLLYISFMHSGANNSPFSLSRPIILPLSLVPRL